MQTQIDLGIPENQSELKQRNSAASFVCVAKIENQARQWIKIVENNRDKCDRDSCVALCDMYLGDLPICNSCFEELKKVIPPESRGSEMIVLVNDFMGGTRDYSRNFYLGSFEPKSQPTLWHLFLQKKFFLDD
jgi:hypothetical protein